MKKTKLENYVKSNGLRCEVTITIDHCSVSLFKDDQLYIRSFKASTLNEAIEKAVNNHRRNENAPSSRNEIQNKKRVRDIHKKLLER